MVDVGVPMAPGTGNETAGPEDAFAPGPKRGDYSGRVGPADYSPHSAGDAQRKYAEGTASVTASSVAAGSDLTTVIRTVTADGTVTRAVYVPDEDITGAATNNRKIALINGGADGSGTTEIASVSFGAGTDAVAGEGIELTLSGTSANLEVSAGDQLKWASTKVGTGIADPGGQGFAIIEVDQP